MTDNQDDDVAVVAERNRLRRVASLPLLNADNELRRLVQVRREADFDRFVERQSRNVKSLMVDGHQGWIAKMGAWSLMRQRLRDEWRNDQQNHLEEEKE